MSWNLVKYGLLAAGWLAAQLYRPPNPMRNIKVVPEKPPVKYQLIDTANRLIIQSEQDKPNRAMPVLLETTKLSELKKDDSCVVFSGDNESIVFILRDSVACQISDLQIANLLRKYFNSKKMAVLGKGVVDNYDPTNKTLTLVGNSSVRIGFRNISKFNKD